MNILCISKYASLPNYGTAARFFHLAKEFKALGHNVSLITSDSNHLSLFPESDKTYNQEDVCGVDVHWIKTKKYRRTASLARVLSWFDFELKLFRFAKKRLPRPDVVIVSSLSLLTVIYGYYLKKKFKIPLVFEVRDIWPLTLTEEGGFGRYHPLVILLGFVERFGYRNADLIVGTMPRLDLHVKKQIGHEGSFFCSPLGYDKEQEKKECSRNNIELDKFFPKNKMIIGYAGSMGISNALDVFVTCIERFNNNNSLHFVLVGSGDLKEKYQQRLQNSVNVTFVPRIAQKDVPYFLSKCDLLYLSTHDSKVWEYGQSMNKVLQYMLAEKPIVASYSGYQSMINEAKSGFFVPANDVNSLYELLSKLKDAPREELKAMGKEGRNWVIANRSYRVLAKQYITQILKITKVSE